MLSDDLKALKTSVETSGEESKGALSDLGDRVSVLERNKEVTETQLLDTLTEKLKEMVSSNDTKPHTEYLLDEIKKQSKKLSIAGVNGAASNYEAVNEFIKDIFKADEIKSIIGKFSCHSGPVREYDKKKTAFVVFSSEGLMNRMFHASFGRI